MDDGHVESFNGCFREECLDAQMFFSLDEARKVIEAWRQGYTPPGRTAPLAASALKSTEEPGEGKPIRPESELSAGILGGEAKCPGPLSYELDQVLGGRSRHVDEKVRGEKK